MARPLRIELAGALYHVTSRGDRCEAIYEDDEDREVFLGILAEVVERFYWLWHAYCLMANHCHLVVETPDGNLSKGMRQLNGVFTRATNRRHERHLMAAFRYVAWNPVIAKLSKTVSYWAWSGMPAHFCREDDGLWLL